jgi:hypothetical protein
MFYDRNKSSVQKLFGLDIVDWFAAPRCAALIVAAIVVLA